MVVETRVCLRDEQAIVFNQHDRPEGEDAEDGDRDVSDGIRAGFNHHRSLDADG